MTPRPEPTPARRFFRFLATALQVGLLFSVARRFEIENPVFYERIVPLAGFGFLAHYWLPRRLRIGWFLALSVVGILWALGLPDGLWLLGLGLALLGTCHLPAPLRVRVALLVAVGAGLAFLRASPAQAPWPASVLPILASMFMFRIIVYLYDREHATADPSLQHALAYFFMLPNVVFPIFPIVDYATFQRTYYDRDPDAIYAKGIRSVAWGITQLLAYRYLYHYQVVAPEDVASFPLLMQYLAVNYLLILRVVGQYNLVVGLLRLFGFDLPPVVEGIFLASSFTDYWRRANIYWRDFVQKIVFYPCYFRLKKLPASVSLTVSIGVVFLVTWFLHGYQWFWIRGWYMLSRTDLAFWGLFGIGVLANALYESRPGRRRRLAASRPLLREAAGRALGALAMFGTLCVMWSLWTSPSFVDWADLWLDAHVTGTDVLVVVPALLGAYAVLLVSVLLLDERHRLPVAAPATGWRPALGWTGMAVLLLLGTPLVSLHGDAATPAWLRTLANHELNPQDAELLTRGYYEDLNAVHPLTGSQLWELHLKQEGIRWPTLRDTAAGTTTRTFLKDSLVPDVNIEFHGAPLRTNKWGMRDQDYEKAKPIGAYRIAVLGASGAFGSGVANDETFEAVLETLLNQADPAEAATRYEVLNFSVPGYCPLQHLALLESKVLAFQPDAVFLVATAREGTSSARHLAAVVTEGIGIPYDFLRRIAAEARVDEHTPFERAFRRLRGHEDEMLTETYDRMVRLCREHGAVPVYAYTPVLQDTLKERDRPLDEELIGQASAAGFVVLDASHALDGEDTVALRVRPWDWHPNARAHRLIAERLYELVLDCKPLRSGPAP